MRVTERMAKKVRLRGTCESKCGVMFVPQAKLTSNGGEKTKKSGRKQTRGRGMAGDTRRKTEGTVLIRHVASLTDSRPGDRAGWLVLCRSGSGHGSAVSALTEIPTP